MAGQPLVLHGMSSPNVGKVVLMLEETALPYEFRRVGVMAGEQNDAAFLALNPNGKVPVLVDPDGPDGPVTIFESGAILIYLAEKTGRFLPAHGAARYAALQWLMFQMAGLGPNFGQAIHFNFATKEDGYGRRRFTIELKRLIEVVEERLGAAPFLAGDDYSIADVAVFPWRQTIAKFFPAEIERPNIVRWSAAIEARPAVARMRATLDPVAQLDGEAMRAATPAQRDLYFGRVERPSQHP